MLTRAYQARERSGCGARARGSPAAAAERLNLAIYSSSEAPRHVSPPGAFLSSCHEHELVRIPPVRCSTLRTQRALRPRTCASLVPGPGYREAIAHALYGYAHCVVARWVSVCHYTYSVLGFSGTQSFHINVRKRVRFQHRDEKIPGRLCRESSLALSCVVCVGARLAARSPPTAAVRLRRPRPAARRAQSPRTPRMQGLSSGLFSYEKHICVAAKGGS